MDVAVVGAGRVGTAMAVLLSRAGHHIVAVAGRSEAAGRASHLLPGTPVLGGVEAAAGAEVVLIGTPDDAIGSTCEELARGGGVGAGQFVGHLSGATGLDVLEPARAAGATAFSIHPLQTFPDVGAGLERIPGCFFAITAGEESGFSVGERLATDVGGRPFRLGDGEKALYHAAAVFASNYLVAVIAEAEEVFRAAGLPEPLEAFLPLARASLENAGSMGPGAALTGPAVRGDAGTVSRNLRALAAAVPEAVPAYVALAGVALDVGERAGRLAPDARAAVEQVLGEWR